MTTLLIALGILITFGALFWLDSYNTGVEKESTESTETENESIEP